VNDRTGEGENVHGDDRAERPDVTDAARVEELKREAARKALAHVESGMRLGLGTGSTVAHFLDLLGESLASGKLANVAGVPTSQRTAGHARRLGIPLMELDGTRLDLGVDGADEVDPGLNLVKGMGGALLREKMVAQAADRFIVIVDGSKEVARLGERSAVPIEVVPFGWKSHLPTLHDLGASSVEIRCDARGRPDYTDNGNVLLDCSFDGFISDPFEMEAALARRSGIVETGLFLGLATEVFVADAQGTRHRSAAGDQT
jgi:ribose 5-phosphate isomerase A